VLAEDAKERQGERNDLKVVEDNNIQEKIPECSKYEPQARDKAASIIGNTNARYVQDAKKIEREAHVMVYNELQTEEFINESTNQYAD